MIIYNYHNFMYASTLEGSKPTWNWWKVQSFNLARYTPWSCFLQTSSNIFGLWQANHGFFCWYLKDDLDGHGKCPSTQGCSYSY